MSAEKVQNNLTAQMMKISKMLNDLRLSDGNTAGFKQGLRRRLSSMVTAEYR